LEDIKMDNVCVHSRRIFVEYMGATLLDMEHIECTAGSEPKKKKTEDCQSCMEGEIGIVQDSCPLFDMFRMTHPIDLSDNKEDSDANRESS
jgi:hypothetical protein